MRKFLLAILATMIPLPLPILAQPQERVDLNVIHKIKTEEFEHSKVMDIMYNLTDRYGPRLTNSPQFRAAGDWAVKQLEDWGLSKVHLEKWGPFGNGWECDYFAAGMMEPTYQPLIGMPVAWTMGTNGPVTGEAMLAPILTPADLEKFHGKLEGKIVLVSEPRELPFPATPLGHRYTAEELNDLALDLIPTGGRGGRGGPPGPPPGPPGQPNMTFRELRAFRQRQQAFWREEKPAVVVQISSIGESGTLVGGGADREHADNPPQVILAAEHYNRIARLLQHEVPVKLSFDIKNRFLTENPDSFNVLAEIPGGVKADELVMVGGHFDSWHYGTGATDNGAGATLAMEVMRILKSLNLKMDRSVRMALWGGEEEGLLGSAAYVKEHFADPTVMKPTAEHAKLSGYFNIDNGTGRIRGIYLQGNEMARPIFESWFTALKDLTPGIVTIRNTGGTDHQSFDAVGLPGFQFIQDPMDYFTRTHHTNMDVYDRIQQQDMEEMAVIEADFVYNAATRADKLPRKDLPAPRPAGGGRGSQ
ncbi:MAG: M20/M25/M40 family metallo-hydrolase [Bryobacteraceae bacterium]